MQDFIVNNIQIIYPILSIWALVWKGLALWKAARKEAKVWFVLILVLNTVGLLEILYIFVLSKIDFAKTGAKIKSSRLLAKFSGKGKEK